MAIARVFNDDGGTLPSSGSSGAEVTENLSNQIDGVNTTFTTNHKFVAGSLRVFYNGIREILNVTVTENAGRTSFSLTFNPLSGDYLIVDYTKDLE